MRIIFLLTIIAALSFSSCIQETREHNEKKEPEKILTDEELHSKADSLAKYIIIVDTHIDVPYRLGEKWEDISQISSDGILIIRVRNEVVLMFLLCQFMFPAKYEGTGEAKIFADKLISMVENISSKHPDKFAIAYSVADVTKQFNNGIISFALGMENGSPIEGKLSNVRYFYNKGIRYITLAHAKNNHISDSSYEKKKKWNGLSPFGKEVVKEMNRLGIMVDVSHISDSAFYDVINISKAPVIASHSSCRHFTPGWERNMSDEMIKALAKNGGVIQISFGSSFLDDSIRRKENEDENYVSTYIKDNQLDSDSALSSEKHF